MLAHHAFARPRKTKLLEQFGREVAQMLLKCGSCMLSLTLQRTMLACTAPVEVADELVAQEGLAAAGQADQDDY